MSVDLDPEVHAHMRAVAERAWRRSSWWQKLRTRWELVKVFVEIRDWRLAWGAAFREMYPKDRR